MPKATESTTQHYHRISPLSVANSLSSPRQYPSIAANMQSSNMSQSHHAPYATGGPVQPLQHYQQPMPSPVPVQVRASSGAWTPADDAQLMAARAQGLNWQPIQSAYFPNKTPNACRKRHERLMDRRNSDDWDVVKFETLAKEYMGMRREIWAPLGAKTGEKWSVVEAKCMQSGLKNLQAAARACSRRERLEGSSLSGSGGGSGGSSSLGLHVHDPRGPYDDSAVGLDDLEAEYHSQAETNSYEHSSPEDDPRNGGPVKIYPNPVSNVNGRGGGYDGRGGGYVDSSGRGYDNRVDGYGSQQHQQQMMQRDADQDRGYGGMGRTQYGLQPRLPSIDMGIGAIINRAPGSL